MIMNDLKEERMGTGLKNMRRARVRLVYREVLYMSTKETLGIVLGVG